MKPTLTHLAAAGVAAALAAQPFAALADGHGDIQEIRLEVVGTWGNLENWKQFEERFWTEILPEASGGKITANAKPYTELGLKGYEVMAGVRKGAFDAVHALTSYSSQASPALEGIDLSGIIQDWDTYREAVDAYRGVVEREVREKYNAQIINMYPFPSQQLWCNLGDAGDDVALADLAGKKIRTYSRTQGDFVEGLGASSVTIAFAEVVPALEKGVADCGVTGTMPAYNAKWYQVVTHNIRVRLGFAATFTAINLDTWDGMNEATQNLILAEAAKLENEIWAFESSLDQLGMDCNAQGPCDRGEPGGMVGIEPDAEDQALLARITAEVTVPRWAERCGAECAQEWNDTIGKVIGVEAPTSF
ncbi:MAG: TRAP transporter substrate-binding protein [Pseudomonadota bacterium]